jgi:serine protease Do/serine protease DegQ
LRARDVVVALSGRPVHAAAEMRARLGLTPVGEEIELRVLRGSESRVIRTRIAPPREAAEGEGRAVPELPGMTVVAIEQGSLLYQQLRGGGLVVSTVEQASRAWQAGFRSGDILYAVNRRRVQSLAEFQKAAGGSSAGISTLRSSFDDPVKSGRAAPVYLRAFEADAYAPLTARNGQFMGLTLW